MRTNGFIFIALGLTAVSMAGTPGYLPSVGPLALRFERAATAGPAVPLPASATQSDSAPVVREDLAVELPVTPPNNSTPATLMHDAPVALPEALTVPPTNSIPALIGPMMDTNGVITPQMFLRFFTPPQGGVSREAILVAPPGFNPAQPPTPSSTATYTQPKP